MHHANTVENMFQRRAERAVIFIAHRFQINLVRAHIRLDIFQDLTRRIAVGHIGAQKSFAFCLRENFDRPLARNQRLVVRTRHHARVLLFADFDQLLRRDQRRRTSRFGVAQRLGNVPVLTIAAVKVAAQHSKRQRIARRQNMKKGFLFDWVALQRGDVPARHEQCSADVVTHLTDAAPAVVDFAVMRAGKTMHAIVGQFFVQSAFAHHRIDGG
ncbi:MAG: hypothetical protein HDKAJFGB_01415 [Anaerolineae bacterium]|nr:hypothetical protein [Anaerolineae bacterium]